MNQIASQQQFDEVHRFGQLNHETGLRELADYRRVIHQSELLRVVDISASCDNPPAPGHADSFQVALPYYGIFSYHVGSATCLVDVNQTLFVTAGRDFHDAHPAPGIGHASLVLIPAPSLLDELAGSESPRMHPAFAAGTQPATIQLRLLAHRIRAATLVGSSLLEGDELVLGALNRAFSRVSGRRARQSSRITDRAKELVHARGYEPLSLGDIARELGVSPVYLTQTFKRAEGLPLYKYQLRVRLDRALLELPASDNITDLALSLGFSSHSHLTSAFRAAFGLTPSQYRAIASTPARSHSLSGKRAEARTIGNHLRTHGAGRYRAPIHIGA